MEIISINEVAIKTVLKVLIRGGLVIYPTETVYGIGADATNQKSVNKLTLYKNRPFGKPYSVAVSDISMADKYVHINKTARQLYKKFLPGPLTVVSKGKHVLAKGIESEDGTLGIRIPDYKFVTDLVRAFGKPITATSANASYKKRPYTITDVFENISVKQRNLIDLVVDAGKLPKNEPSTVVDTTLDDSVILRQGDIKLKNKLELLSKSEEGTMSIAKELWHKYEYVQGKRAIIFALEGEMGAGKTIFTKGIAKAMGIDETVISPTFVLENEYQTGNNKLYHFDAWRMLSGQELRDLGFDNLIRSKSVLSIEWSEKVADVIREFDDEAVIVWIKIVYGKHQNQRFVSWGTT